MGWWEEDELTLGDEPFDICRCALEQVVSKYEHHVGRPPTLQEVLTYVRHALNTVGTDSIPDLDSIEVQSVAIKSKKTPKRQQYEVGDYFAIPLDGEFAYGRIVDDDAHLVEIYELFTDTMLTFGQLVHRAPAVRTWKYIFSRPAFQRRRWIILGSAEMDPDYDFPLFYMGSGGGRVPIGDTGPLRRRYSRSELAAHAEHLEGIESHTIWEPETIEDHLKRRVPDPWPVIIEKWNRDGIPWRGSKSRYPVFFKDLPLKKLRAIRLHLETFSDEDLELILRLKGIEFVTIECDEPGSKRKQNSIAKTLKEKLPKLIRISLDDEVQRLDQQTGTWHLDE